MCARMMSHLPCVCVCQVSAILVQMQTFLMGLEDCEHEVWLCVIVMMTCCVWDGIACITFTLTLAPQHAAVADALRQIPAAVRATFDYRCTQCAHVGMRPWPSVPTAADALAAAASKQVCVLCVCMTRTPLMRDVCVGVSTSNRRVVVAVAATCAARCVVVMM
jgi:hypothetical protein